MLLAVTTSDVPLDEAVNDYLSDKTIAVRKWATWWLKDFSAWLVETGYMEENPLKDLQRPSFWRRKDSPYLTFDARDIKKLNRLRDLSAEQRLLINILIECPLMKCEVQVIEKDSFDFTTNNIVITGRRARHIPISPELTTTIKNSFKKKPRKYLLQRPDGKPFSEYQLDVMLANILKNAGLKKSGATFKIFRESWLQDGDANLEDKLPLYPVKALNNLRGAYFSTMSTIEKQYANRTAGLWLQLYYGLRPMPGELQQAVWAELGIL